MRRRRFFALLLSATLLATSINMEALAVENNDGYTLVWSDEFNGDSLDRSKWNVETHEAGWVNSELQEYVDSADNISVDDGMLKLTAQREVAATVDGNRPGNRFVNADFSNGKEGWIETIANWGGDYVTDASSSTSNGKIKYTINNPGTEDWHVQLKQSGLNLQAGKTYVVSYDVTSSVARQIKSGVMSTSYVWYSGSDPYLEAGVNTNIAFAFKMNVSDPAADFYISLGKVGDTPTGTVTISNLYFTEVGYSEDAEQDTETTAPEESAPEEGAPEQTAPAQTTSENLLSNADFASGLDRWAETIANWDDSVHAVADRSIENGAITYNISDVGDADWNIQLKQTGIELKEGSTYRASYNINSTVSRQIKSGVMSASYDWFGGSDPVLSEGRNDISFTFKMNSSDSGDFYISLGNCGGSDEAGVFTISNISLVELLPAETTDSDDNEDSDDSNQSEENADGTTNSPSTQIEEIPELPQAEKVESYSYTSGRISTQNLATFTYGKFECRAKVPAGQGYLPAFWLMANDENVYGQWPRCGEIDCMEVMGQDTSKVYGTIHYGNPHGESQGTYVTEDSSFSDDFHTYTCEWEPGKITWYVDGIKYHEESNWYSTTEGVGTLTYPAPFDQPFYIILNLAVGGEWVGYPDENTSFDNNPYVIDYVRVYQKDSYNENVEKPETPVDDLRAPGEDGNYIVNGSFKDAEDNNWVFLTANEGVGSASIKNDEIVIKTTNAGVNDYSIQLVQADLPIEKGATYQVQFDAYSTEDREMGVDVKAPDHGYIQYMPHQTAKLTTTKQTYTYTFKMKSDTDKNARLEYNMGATDSTADIHISNVSFTKIADYDPNAREEKSVLSNGSYVYNGGFDQGLQHLGYWDVTASADVEYAVSGYSDGRRFTTTLDDNDSVALFQDSLGVSVDAKYAFTMDIDAEKAGQAIITLGQKDYTVAVIAGRNTYTVDVDTTNIPDKDLTIKLIGGGQVAIDNIKLTDKALIKNGSFTDGLTGYEVFIDSSAKAEKVVDSITEDNALDITIKDTGDQDWKVQVKQENVPLEKGKTYQLTLKIKSNIERKARIIMQGQENRGWAVYSHDNVVSLTSEYQTLTDVFTMEEETDAKAFLSICLGKIDEQIKTQHRVVIDDISLVEITPVDDKNDDSDEEDKKPLETPTIIPSGNNNANTQTENTNTSNGTSANNNSYVADTTTSSDAPAATGATVTASTTTVASTPVVRQALPAATTPAATPATRTANSTPASRPAPLPNPELDPALIEEAQIPLAGEETETLPEAEVPAAAESDESIVEIETPAKQNIFLVILNAIKNFFLAIFNFFR